MLWIYVKQQYERFTLALINIQSSLEVEVLDKTVYPHRPAEQGAEASAR